VSPSKPFPSLVSSCLFLVCFSASFAIAQSPDKQTGSPGTASSSQEEQTPPPNVPGAPQPPPNPGELGWPFLNEHWWNHWALELGGGYVLVVNKGTGYFDHGFLVTTGVLDHVRPNLNLMVEFQFFGLQGSQQISQYSNTDFTADIAASYALFSRFRNSPYLIGGAGYYYLGPLGGGGSGTSCSGTLCPPDASYTANRAGFQVGLGFRHRLFTDKATELFVEGRYHYIESASSYGQLSLMPVSGGIRW